MADNRDDAPRSLFRNAFAPYVATAGVRVGYVLWFAATTLLCVLIVLTGYGRSTSADVVSLTLVAPLVCLVSLASGRVFIKAILAILGLRLAETPVLAEARVPAGTLPRR